VELPLWLNAAGHMLRVQLFIKVFCTFEVVDWSEERANRITNAKVGNRLLGVTAVKSSRKSEAEAGEARRGPVAQRTTRTALDSLGSGKLWD
jgi:hypothetical protein